ncbi:hypothetical protein BKK51_12170 [Rodentibacter trehalosifermentans]|uniref:Uncharacterized protein n=1 Tax=Rodentibacter trehalosifermentans TaxID=1908263 RepID=A0A1V3IMZ1_9PAST|nr:hypothetical protein [Rodentibacter trehalosifermentans]OOF43032.1 hypothetical protein BKK51_12170 [Rodentibacter trehalosifermentans]
MALKTKEITIEKGRDAGVRFIITEMPVVKADKWATKVLIALMNAGVEVPDVKMGMLGITTMLLSSLQNVDAEKAIPLLDELLDCVQIIPEGGSPRKLDLSMNDVQDFTTLWVLRKEALMLHLDFLQLANTQISA